MTKLHEDFYTDEFSLFSHIEDDGKQRYANHCLILYDDPSVFLYVIEQHKDDIEHYAYILHDRDVYLPTDKRVLSGDVPENTPKEPHYHLVVNLRSGRGNTSSAVRKWFQGFCRQNVFCQGVRKNLALMLSYLTHSDKNSIKSNKVIYEQSEIVCDDVDWFHFACPDEGNLHINKTLSIINDILNNCPLTELMRRYGRDVVVNYSRYSSYAFRIKLEEADEFTRESILLEQYSNPRFIAEK